MACALVSLSMECLSARVTRPDGVGSILRSCLLLYARFPLLFSLVTLAVVAPLDVLLVALGGTSRSGNGSLVAALVSWLGGVVIETPLVTALHVVAVRELDQGRRPTIRGTLTAGVTALPAVAPVVVLYTFGVAGGLVLLIIPGIVLSVWWLVAAPVAVVEEVPGPAAALSRSRQLLSGSFGRGLVILLAPIVLGIVTDALVPAPRHAAVASTDFLVDLVVQTVVQSFAALTATLLYFSLSPSPACAGGSESSAPRGRSQHRRTSS